VCVCVCVLVFVSAMLGPIGDSFPFVLTQPR